MTILDTGLDELHLTSGDGPANVPPGGCRYALDTGGETCYDIQTNIDRRGHGAHVAGIIAGRNNSFGYIGIANNVGEFESIRVCRPDSRCPPDAVAQALDYVRFMSVIRPRQVVNMTQGYCQNYTPLSEAVARAYDEGILLIASAGNRYVGGSQTQYCGSQVNNLPDWSTSVYWPARYSQVMAVSGTLENDEFAMAAAPPPPPPDGGTNPCDTCATEPSAGVCGPWGSRYGAEVEIAAPFSDSNMTRDGGYTMQCGTSFSAPAVTAVAALVWSHYPGWTAPQVRQRLKDTAVQLGGTFGFLYFGSGRVNAFHAVYGLADPPPNPPPQPPPQPPPPPTATITGPSEVRPYATCRFEATTTLPDGPYSYEWFVDDVPMNSYESYYYHTAATASFSLRVTVQNSQGQRVQGLRNVTVSASAPECLDQ